MAQISEYSCEKLGSDYFNDDLSLGRAVGWKSCFIYNMLPKILGKMETAINFNERETFL